MSTLIQTWPDASGVRVRLATVRDGATGQPVADATVDLSAVTATGKPVAAFTELAMQPRAQEPGAYEVLVPPGVLAPGARYTLTACLQRGTSEQVQIDVGVQVARYRGEDPATAMPPAVVVTIPGPPDPDAALRALAGLPVL
jgi:hypothetical protein